MQPPVAYHEDAVLRSLEELDRAPPLSVVEMIDLFVGASDEPHDSLSRPEFTQPLSPPPSVLLSEAEHVDEPTGNPCIMVDGEESPEGDERPYPSPSPTPSEHGSNTSQLQLHTSQVMHTTINNETQLPSPESSVSSESLSDSR